MNMLRNGRNLLENSSNYALAQIAQSSPPKRKLWWLLALLLGLLGSGLQINEFIDIFQEYPIAVDVSIDNKANREFPAVTICNSNRMPASFFTCIEQVPSTGICYPDLGSGSLILSEAKSLGSCSNVLNGTMDKNTEIRLAFLMNYTKLDSGYRRSYGYQFDSLVKDCAFNGRSCLKNFSYFQNLRYGNCYTFNKNGTFRDAAKQFLVIGTKGLELTLSVNYDSYLPFTPSIGVRLVIHDPNEDPNPEEEGFSISPGFETSIEITQVTNRRLPAPYRDRCVDYRNDKTVRGKSRNDCVRQCMQEQNFALCLCIDPTLPSFNYPKLCNMTNSTEMCCLDDALKSMETNGLPCSCPLPCVSKEYHLRISTAVWPSLPYFSATSCRSCNSDWYRNMYLNWVRKSQAVVKISCSNLQNTVFGQLPMFDDSELLGSVGGFLSLWLGLSLMFAFEIIQFLIYIFKYAAQRKE